MSNGRLLHLLRPWVIAVVLSAFAIVQVRAQNAGSDWSVPVNFSQRLDTFSDVPVLLCDQYQTVHVFWAEREDDQTLIYHRDNVGGSWSNPNDVLVTRSVLELYGAVAPNDTVHLIWFTATRGELVYSRVTLASMRDAKHWAEPMELASEVDGASLSIDKAGVLHLVYSTSDANGLNHVANYIRSVDNGLSWSTPIEVMNMTVPVGSAMGVMVGVDGKGRLHVVWQIRAYTYGEYSRVGYIRSTDEGNTWGNAMTLASSETPPGVAAPAVYTFGEDEIHLTYDLPERVHRWSTDGGATWSQPITIMQLGAAFGGVNQLVKDSAGTLHVVSAVSDGVYQAAWNGSSWGAPEAIDRRYYDAHHQQLVVCQGNQLHVVYDDRRGEHEIWYSTKLVNAPLIPQRAVPVPQAVEASPAPEATLAAGSVEVSRTGSAELQTVQVRTAPALWNPVLTPALLVISLVIGVAAILLRRVVR